MPVTEAIIPAPEPETALGSVPPSLLSQCDIPVLSLRERLLSGTNPLSFWPGLLKSDKSMHFSVIRDIE